MMRIFLFIGVVFSALVSCCNKIEYDIYYNKDLDDITTIASDANSPFCIVLVDSTHFTTDDYINITKAYKDADIKTIYNFIDINMSENKWYSKLLSPQIYPITCIFNQTGQLIDLVPSNSNEGFAYVNQVIKTGIPSVDFHYNQKYDQDKIEYVKYVNKGIELKLRIDRKQYVVDEIDSLLQVANHPYLLYLKLQNELMFNREAEAKTTANELLTFDSVQDLIEYYDEFLTANQILDSTYNTQTAPIISTCSNIIELSDCEINHTYNLDIKIMNKGKRRLKISDILTSCSCVKLKSAKKHIVDVGETLNLKIEFTPDVTGDIYREIYIASNSLNTPLYTITINAMAK